MRQRQRTLGSGRPRVSDMLALVFLVSTVATRSILVGSGSIGVDKIAF